MLEIDASEYEFSPLQFADDISVTVTSDPCPPPPNTTSSTLEVFTCLEGSRMFMGVTGPGTLIQYQDILQGLVYFNSADEPDKNETNKTVSVSIIIYAKW